MRVQGVRISWGVSNALPETTFDSPPHQLFQSFGGTQDKGSTGLTDYMLAPDSERAPHPSSGLPLSLRRPMSAAQLVHRVAAILRLTPTPKERPPLCTKGSRRPFRGSSPSGASPLLSLRRVEKVSRLDIVPLLSSPGMTCTVIGGVL